MKLILAEKPSTARAYAAVLNVSEQKNGYLEGAGFLISWCIGHLVELAGASVYGNQYQKWSYDSLPILPQEWQYTVLPEKEKQFQLIKALMHRDDVSEIINACDAGREGEYIFRLVYAQAGCQKPIRRLWISSMEENAIKKGFGNLKDGQEYDALYRAALCRAKADWSIGINATRLFSCLYGKTLQIGRVQTPTLKLLADRNREITTFKKETYYQVSLTLRGVKAVSAKIHALTEADRIKTACGISQAVCISVMREQHTEIPPKLFDLTSLQKEANRIYGYTAKQTLDLAQQLYEKRLLTYPRTDSTFLTEDMKDTAENIAWTLTGQLPFMQGAEFSPDVSKVLNQTKVSDHCALIPTMEIVSADLTELPEKERNIMVLVGMRFLLAVAQPHRYESVCAVFRCADSEFTAKGKTVISDGWKALEQRYWIACKERAEEESKPEDAIPLFGEGEQFDHPKAEVTVHDTVPPKQHTEATLLSAMERAGKAETVKESERKGLGTPATRASVIEKLVKSGFVKRKGKQLIPTENGQALIDILPDVLTSPHLTAEWENALTEIAKDNRNADHFMCGIYDLVRKLVQDYSCISESDRGRFQDKKAILGQCPRCGSNVLEGKKNYYCENRECCFVMWKNDRFFEERKTAFTPKLACALLKSGRARVKGLYSVRTGKTYDGIVVLADTGGKYVNYRIEIPMRKNKSKGAVE